MYFPLYSHFNAFTLKIEAELVSGKLVKPCVHFNNREKRGKEIDQLVKIFICIQNKRSFSRYTSPAGTQV